MSVPTESQAGLLSRRRFFRFLSAISAALGAPSLVSSAETPSSPAASLDGEDYYAKLGVPTIINAAGTYTTLTAACMPPRSWPRCRRPRSILSGCMICSRRQASTLRGASTARGP